MLLLPQSAKQDSINATGKCSVPAMPTHMRTHTCTNTHTHMHNISPLCIIWLPVLQGKAGLIEVISIRVWVDWSGNKDQGPFVHICMYVYMHVCVCVGDWVLLRLYHFSPSHSIWSLCIICFYYYKKEAHRACLVVPLWGAPDSPTPLSMLPNHCSYMSNGYKMSKAQWPIMKRRSGIWGNNICRRG